MIKKLKLKPNADESKYSQSFIERERSMVNNLLKKCDRKINDRKGEYLLKQKKFNDMTNELI